MVDGLVSDDFLVGILTGYGIDILISGIFSGLSIAITFFSSVFLIGLISLATSYVTTFFISFFSSSFLIVSFSFPSSTFAFGTAIGKALAFGTAFGIAIG